MNQEEQMRQFRIRLTEFRILINTKLDDMLINIDQEDLRNRKEIIKDAKS